MSTDVPFNANDGCPGTQSDQAGKSNSCSGCPNQRICASGEAKKLDPALEKVTERLSKIRHKILVLSGKGGVGKSTFAAQLSMSLASSGKAVGLLDIDICGPSIPQMLGLVGQPVHQSSSGWTPVCVNDNLLVMSIGFMLPNNDDAIIWRGPRKNGLIKQFLTDVEWDALDYLIIDTPPGTSDEHISILQYLKASPADGAIIVTTPQEVSLADVRKEISFCKKTQLPILGVVENMSSYIQSLKIQLQSPPSEEISIVVQAPTSTAVYPEEEEYKSTPVVVTTVNPEQIVFTPSNWDTPQTVTAISSIFPLAGGGAEKMAADASVPFLGRVPLDPNIVRACEEGSSFLSTFPDSVAAESFQNIVTLVLQYTGGDQETSVNELEDE